MLRSYRVENGDLRRAEGSDLDAAAIWLDLHNPTREEEQAVEALLKIGVPTREEMAEIEFSSRLYEEDGALFMTVQILHKAESDIPQNSAVTFILAGGKLVTLRYSDPRPFQTFTLKAERHPQVCATAETVLLGLLDAVIDRLADILEITGARVDELSQDIFQLDRAVPHPRGSLESILQRVGRRGDFNSKARESLASLDRLVTFLNPALGSAARKEIRARLKTMSRDLTSMADYADFMGNKITFLLDATLGLISIQQTKIIKIFSVASVAFLPPTLVASIYGMNFDFMPETHWKLGYPMALGIMLVSAILPYLYFKRKGWL